MIRPDHPANGGRRPCDSKAQVKVTLCFLPLIAAIPTLSFPSGRGGFAATWRIATDHKRTADEYFVWLSSLMMLTKTAAQVAEAIISSTVPRVVFNLRAL